MLQIKLLSRSLTVLIWIAFITSQNFSQTNFIHFKHISIEQGLPTNLVNCVYQDRKGFIWIGTDKGLVRYDGYNYRNYRHNKDDNNSLSNDIVTSILEDSEGNFWIGTQGGLNKFDRSFNKFSSFTNLPNDTNSIQDNHINILVENNGIIWAGTGSGLSKLNVITNKFTNYTIPANELPNAAISKIINDNGILWIGTKNGLAKFNTKDNVFSIYGINGNGGFHIRSLIIENGNNILIASNEGLYRFNKSNLLFEKLFPEAMNDLLMGLDGKLWCATEGSGIILFDIHTGAKSVYNKETGFSKGIISASYKHIFRDAAGSTWFTSLNEGINILHPGAKEFTVLKNNQQSKNSLSNNIVNKGFTDKDGITWIPTFGGGLDKYNASDKSFIHLRESSLREDKINSVLKDNFGQLWVGTTNGLYLQRLNNIAFDKISFSSYVIRDHPISTIVQDKGGDIWLGINDHLVKYSPQTNATLIVNLVPDSSSFFTNFNISSILSDNDFLWISTSNGLYKYTIKKNSLNVFRDFDPYEVENHFLTIAQDWEGLIWVGTKEAGLKCFNPKTNIFTSYKKENGLPSNNILSILEDADGALWLGTDKGLAKFNNKLGSIVTYTESDGIPSNKFIQNSCWTAPSGEFFFGTDNGILSFFPAKMNSNKFIPPIVLISFKIFNKETALNYETSYITEIEVPYKQNVLSFEIAALNYIDPDKNQFAYKLEGFNNEWTYIKSFREISFTNLSPGTYTLRIIASNNEGIWNEAGLSVNLRILPPWYSSWWAYIIYLLILISIYLAVRRYELKRVQHKNELKLKKVESEILFEAEKVKSDFYNKISHELKTPLTNIIEPVSKLKETLKNDYDIKTLELIDQNTRRLLLQVNHLIDFSRLEAGSMKLQVSRNDCIPFLRGLVMNFEPEAKIKNIKLELYSPLDHLNIYYDHNIIEQVVYNILSNAIKFTQEGGCIVVSVELKSKRLYIKIKDNGIGIPADKIGFIFNPFSKSSTISTKGNGGLGIGLALTKKLIELHKGEIQATSKPGLGTTFTFWINAEDTVYQLSEIKESDKVNLSFRSPNITTEKGNTISDHVEKLIVLLIEGNSEMRRLIVSQLDENYAVFEYPDSTEGFNKAKEIIPDIIVFDETDTKMDKMEFCRIVKNDGNTSHIPIILILSKSPLDEKIKGGENGADDYIIRPFNKLELLMKIKSLISKSRKFREILGKDFVSGLSTLSDSDFELNKADKTFINKVIQAVENNYKISDFNLDRLCNQTGMSQIQLVRKMAALFNKTPNEFILRYRLYKADKLIKEEGKPGSKAAYEVGFDNLSYFTKCYRSEFGGLPNDPIK
jgi:signal transduction histidine kinase/ligand-binding sensor domain-containing protein/DNA-binding response OmpR family regulator